MSGPMRLDKLDAEELAAERPINVRSNMQFHEIANIFPTMLGDDFTALVEDIRAHGLRESIKLFEGKILDGRNRYRACAEAGIEPRFEQFSGCDPLAYVLSLNLERRHLSPSQRAMVAAKLANMRQGERTDLEPSANLRKVSQSDAAKLLNVSERSVSSAKAVCDQAVPELIKKVEQGDISVSKAAGIHNKPTVTGPRLWATVDGMPAPSWLVNEIEAAGDHLAHATKMMLRLNPKMSESERNKARNAFLDIAARASRCAAIFEPEGNPK
jgi:hypothetical protein